MKKKNENLKGRWTITTSATWTLAKSGEMEASNGPVQVRSYNEFGEYTTLMTFENSTEALAYMNREMKALKDEVTGD